MSTPKQQRRFIIFSGDHDWASFQAQAFLKKCGLNESQIYWHQSQDLTINALGQENAVVVMDFFMGLNPDSFGRLSGTIVAGGAMLIICPSFAEWPEYNDPEKRKLAAYPRNPNEISGRFIRRWTTLLSGFNGVEIITPKSLNAPLSISKAAVLEVSQFAHQDEQASLIIEMLRHIKQGSFTPMVLSADRGRGKSTSLGMLAHALLVTEDFKNIIVTASGFRQTTTLFKHAQISNIKADTEKHSPILNPRFNSKLKRLEYNNGCLQYISADALIHSGYDCDILLIDEAASLGLAKLNALLRRYKRIIFATTEHGYEGSGRGFRLKFRALIKQHHASYKNCTLNKPIRWPENDPLEAWTNQLLLLDSKKISLFASEQESNASVIKSAVKISSLSQQDLAQDETLLSHVFLLLQDAHYKTRPTDLRFLLDAPNTLLIIATQDKNLVGLCWATLEGGLDNAVALEIAKGKRRPQGHLAPQILAAHLGLPSAIQLTCARIQRIVVLPQFQAKGIGRKLLSALEKQLNNKIDYITSSFGLDLPLLQFWQKSEFSVVRIGERQNPETGLLPALVIKPQSSSGYHLTEQSQMRFASQFRAQIMSDALDINSNLKTKLLSSLKIKNQENLNHLATHELEAAILFAFASRPFESSRDALLKLAHFKTQQTSVSDSHLLALIFIDKVGWKNCAERSGLQGKNACLAALKKETQLILTERISKKTLAAIYKKFQL